MEDAAASGRGRPQRWEASSAAVGGSYSITMTTTQRPSAYAHYKKLVHDFETLEEDLETTRLEQQQLEETLQRHKSKVAAHEQQQKDHELAAWTRERERQIEEICVKRFALDALHEQNAILDKDETRLLAELAVLHEKQQLENESEAKQIFALVHNSNNQGELSVLDKELTKAQLDLAFLTQIVTTSKRQHNTTQGNDNNQDRQALHALVGTIQQRREDAFRDATAQFQQRIHSFELEKEALRKRSDEMKWKKQRALQVLSSNQQQVIQGFFTTPREAIHDPNPVLPSLAYREIVETMTQPLVQAAEPTTGKYSARRQLNDALASASRNVVSGPQRVEELAKCVHDRQQDAVKLNLLLSPRSTDDELRQYDGRWGIETYRQDQYELVYYVRTLIFDWMKNALEIAQNLPEKQLLEMEIQRFDMTRAAMDKQQDHVRFAVCVARVAQEMEDEVVREMAGSIHKELLYSATRVHDLVAAEMKNVLFFGAAAAQSPLRGVKATTTTTKKPPTGQVATAPTLRWAMFESAWREIKSQRTAESRPRLLLLRPVSTVSGTATVAASSVVATSPKKRFGLFGGGHKTKALTSEPTPSELPPVPSSAVYSVDATAATMAHCPMLQTEVPATATGSDDDQSAEQILWRGLRLSTTCLSSLSECGVVSCVQLSPKGDLLAVGTVDDEIIVFSIDDNVPYPPPIAVRVTPPSLHSTAVSSSSPCRITRLCFSSCGRHVISYNQQKAATLWSLSPVTSTPVTHSSDCFPVETHKFKSTPLHIMMKLHAQELFQEPPVPLDVLTKYAPVAAARLQASPPVAITSVNLFPSISLIGEPRFLICGASNGDLVKVPTGTGTSRVSSLFGSSNEACFDAPHPSDSELTWCLPSSSVTTTSTCKREFFRHAHRHSVIFVSTIAPLAGSTTTRLVSVNQRGGVTLWMYSRAFFTGFGWFRPPEGKSIQLNLSGPSTTSPGEILQIQLTQDRKRLVLMVLFMAASPPSSSSFLRFIQLDLMEILSVVSVRLEVGLVGVIPPRFALVSLLPPPPLRRKTKLRSFLVLLMNNTLSVHSLQTGECCVSPLISLDPPMAWTSLPVQPGTSKDTKMKAAAAKKEPPPQKPLLFNSITATCGRRTRAEADTGELLTSGSSSTSTAEYSVLVIVAGEQHRQIRMYRFSA